MGKRKNFVDCLEILEKINIERGLGTPFKHYKDIGDEYPSVDIELLLPPFSEEIREKSSLHDHINIIMYNFDPRFGNILRKQIPTNKITTKKPMKDAKEDLKKENELSIPGIKNYEFDLSDRVVTSKNFPILWELLMRKDRASLIYPTGEPQKFGLYQFRSKIDPPKRDAELQKLERLCKKNKILVPRKGTRKYPEFLDKLEKKVYETIAWSEEGGGTKHEAAAQLAILSKFTHMVIDVFSKGGVYSRIDVSRTKPITTTHVTIQPIEKFKTLPGDSYKFGEKKSHVIYAVEYQRNDNYSPDSCWVNITGDFFLNPKNPSHEPIRAHHLDELITK